MTSTVTATVLSCKWINEDKHYAATVREDKNGMEHSVRFPDRKEAGARVKVKA